MATSRSIKWTNEIYNETEKCWNFWYYWVFEDVDGIFCNFVTFFRIFHGRGGAKIRIGSVTAPSIWFVPLLALSILIVSFWLFIVLFSSSRIVTITCASGSGNAPTKCRRRHCHDVWKKSNRVFLRWIVFVASTVLIRSTHVMCEVRRTNLDLHMRAWAYLNIVIVSSFLFLRWIYLDLFALCLNLIESDTFWHY